MSPKFQHFLITRFSYRKRAGALAGPGWRTTRDPLEPKRLERRLHLFQRITVPAVRVQSNQDFTWILLIDPELTGTFRTQLKEAIAECSNAVLVEYGGDDVAFTLSWLEPFIDCDTEYVITTNVDDDDAAYDRFVEDIQSHVVASHTGGTLRSVKCIGTTRFVQWDLLWGRRAPMGYVKPWTRNVVITNAWLSLCVAYPAIDVSVLAIQHAKLPDLLASFTPAIQQRIIAAAKDDGDDPGTWTERAIWFDMADANSRTHVLVGNHIYNDENRRLFESRTLRRPFVPSEFPDYTICIADIQSFLLSKGQPTVSSLAPLLGRALSAFFLPGRNGLRLMSRLLFIVPVAVPLAVVYGVGTIVSEMRFARRCWSSREPRRQTPRTHS